MLLHLVDQEGEHGERREDVRQILVSMPEIVLEPVCVPRLQRLERLVLDGPSAAGGSHDGHHRLPVEREVGDPREPLRFSLRVGLLVFQHVDLQVEVRVVERQRAVPLEAVHRAGRLVAPLP